MNFTAKQFNVDILQYSLLYLQSILWLQKAWNWDYGNFWNVTLMSYQPDDDELCRYIYGDEQYMYNQITLQY